MCHTPSQMDTNWTNLEVISSSTHHTLLSCVWLVLSLFGGFSSHKCGTTTRVFCSDLSRVSTQVWPVLTLVNAWPFDLKPSPKFWFLKAAFIGTKTEARRWPLTCCIDFLLLLFCIDHWLDSVDFGLTFVELSWGLCDTFGWLTVRRLSWDRKSVV